MSRVVCPQALTGHRTGGGWAAPRAAGTPPPPPKVRQRTPPPQPEAILVSSSAAALVPNDGIVGEPERAGTPPAALLVTALAFPTRCADAMALAQARRRLQRASSDDRHICRNGNAGAL